MSTSQLLQVLAANPSQLPPSLENCLLPGAASPGRLSLFPSPQIIAETDVGYQGPLSLPRFCVSG